jgi:hypothetical protein
MIATLLVLILITLRGDPVRKAGMLVVGLLLAGIACAFGG